MLKTASLGRNLPSAILLGLDLTGLVLLVAAAILLGGPYPDTTMLSLLTLVVIVPAALYLLDAYGLEPHGEDWRVVIRAIFAVVIVGLLVGLFGIFAGVVAIPIPAVLSGFGLWAVGVRWFLYKQVRVSERRRRWLVLGFGEGTRHFLRQHYRSKMDGQIVLYAPDSKARNDLFAARLEARIVEEPEALDDLLAEQWTSVIISDDFPPSFPLQERLVQARLNGTRFVNMITFFEENWMQLPVALLRRTWFFQSSGFGLVHSRQSRIVKRIIDVSVSLLLLAATAPLIVLVAIAIRLDSPGPFLFRQRRTGRAGSTIEILKFRTMQVRRGRDEARWARRNDPRITRVGRLLRQTHFDEIPQLINVLRGEMSLIGPRPEQPALADKLRLEIPFYDIRCAIKPGLTGWAQVNASYAASLAAARQKLAYDLYYMKNQSVGLDIVIIMKTIRVMLFGRGR